MKPVTSCKVYFEEWRGPIMKKVFKTLLEKTKLVREISDGKNEIPHKFLSRKI